MRYVFLLAVLPMLTACPDRSPIYTPVNVEVPVPIPCQVKIPAAPEWNMKRVKPDAALLDKVKAALADIELRKGYEQQLKAALKACTAVPIDVRN